MNQNLGAILKESCIKHGNRLALSSAHGDMYLMQVKKPSESKFLGIITMNRYQYLRHLPA